MKGPWLHALVVVALCAGGYLLAQHKLEDSLPIADSAQYVIMAHNAFHRGVISLTPPAQDPPAPSAYREPGYPVFLAAVMALDDGLATSSVECLTSDTPECRAVYSGVRLASALLTVAAGLLVWAAVWRLARNPTVAHGALFLMLGNLELHEFTTSVISDPFALFLTALLSLVLVLSYQSERPLVTAVVTGLALGALVLTKAAFMYLVIFIAAAFLVRLVTAKVGKRRQLAACLLAFLVAYGTIVGAWIWRNDDALGEPVITQRGGEVLALRVELNTMTAKEYGLSFLWWTRGFGDNLVRREFAEQDYRRFEQDRPDGFYNAAVAKSRAALDLEMRAGIDAITAERHLTARMIDQILRNFPKNLMTTLPIAYRGMAIDEFMVLTFPALIVLLIGAARRLPGYYWFALPGLYVFGFNSLLTLNLPRFNIPLLPALAGAGSIAIWWAIKAWRARREQRLS